MTDDRGPMTDENLSAGQPFAVAANQQPVPIPYFEYQISNHAKDVT